MANDLDCKILLSAKQVMATFGGICEMTLYRWLADKAMAFPQPLYIRKRRYFDATDIAAFKERIAQPARRARLRPKPVEGL